MTISVDKVEFNRILYIVGQEYEDINISLSEGGDPTNTVTLCQIPMKQFCVFDQRFEQFSYNVIHELFQTCKNNKINKMVVVDIEVVYNMFHQTVIVNLHWRQ